MIPRVGPDEMPIWEAVAQVLERKKPRAHHLSPWCCASEGAELARLLRLPFPGSTDLMSDEPPLQ